MPASEALLRVIDTQCCVTDPITLKCTSQWLEHSIKCINYIPSSTSNIYEKSQFFPRLIKVTWDIRKTETLDLLCVLLGTCSVVFLSIYSFIYLLILLLSARWATVAMYNRRFRRCCYIRRRIYFVLLSILAPALNPSWLTKRVMCSESLFCSQGLYVLKSVISLRSTSLTPGRKQ